MMMMMMVTTTIPLQSLLCAAPEFSSPSGWRSYHVHGLWSDISGSLGPCVSSKSSFLYKIKLLGPSSMLLELQCSAIVPGTYLQTVNSSDSYHLQGPRSSSSLDVKQKFIYSQNRSLTHTIHKKKKQLWGLYVNASINSLYLVNTSFQYYAEKLKLY